MIVIVYLWEDERSSGVLKRGEGEHYFKAHLHSPPLSVAAALMPPGRIGDSTPRVSMAAMNPHRVQGLHPPSVSESVHLHPLLRLGPTGSRQESLERPPLILGQSLGGEHEESGGRGGGLESCEDGHLEAQAPATGVRKWEGEGGGRC